MALCHRGTRRAAVIAAPARCQTAGSLPSCRDGLHFQRGTLPAEQVHSEFQLPSNALFRTNPRRPPDMLSRAASQGSRCLCKSSDECFGTEEKKWKTKAGCNDAMNPCIPQLEETFRPARPEVGQGCTGHSERNSSATTSAIHQMEHSLPLLSFWTSAGMVLNGSWQEFNTEIVNYRRATAAVLTLRVTRQAEIRLAGLGAIIN